MKQIWIGFGWIAWMMLVCQDEAIAQRSKTKCPSSKTTWKSRQERKSLVKFEELKDRQRDIAHAERKQQKAEKKQATDMAKAERTRQKQAVHVAKAEHTTKKSREHTPPRRSNYYTKDKVVKMKQVKASRGVASTNCPH